MFFMDFVEDLEAAAEAFLVFVVWIGSVGDRFWPHSPLWLTFRLLRAPIPDARADPLEEVIVLGVLPDAISKFVVGRTEIVDALEEMESLGRVELVGEVDVTAP